MSWPCCPNCGSEVSDNQNRCRHCGEPVNIDHEPMQDNIYFNEMVSICPSCNSKVIDNSKFCSNCGYKLQEVAVNDAVLHNRISYLEKRVQSLESKIPYTAILNNSFISRAFAIYGHVIVAGLIVGLPLYLIFFLVFAAASN